MGCCYFKIYCLSNRNLILIEKRFPFHTHRNETLKITVLYSAFGSSALWNCTLWYIFLENNTKAVGMSLHNVDTYIVFVYLSYSLVNSVRNKCWIIVNIFIAYNCFYNFNQTYCISFTYFWFHFYVRFSINTCTFVQDAILYYSLPMTQAPAPHCTL